MFLWKVRSFGWFLLSEASLNRWIEMSQFWLVPADFVRNLNQSDFDPCWYKKRSWRRRSCFELKENKTVVEVCWRNTICCKNNPNKDNNTWTKSDTDKHSVGITKPKQERNSTVEMNRIVRKPNLEHRKYSTTREFSTSPSSLSMERIWERGYLVRELLTPTLLTCVFLQRTSSTKYRRNFGTQMLWKK